MGDALSSRAGRLPRLRLGSPRVDRTTCPNMNSLPRCDGSEGPPAQGAQGDRRSALHQGGSYYDMIFVPSPDLMIEVGARVCVGTTGPRSRGKVPQVLMHDVCANSFTDKRLHRPNMQRTLCRSCVSLRRACVLSFLFQAPPIRPG
jgi:hypothetical protein